MLRLWLEPVAAFCFKFIGIVDGNMVTLMGFLVLVLPHQSIIDKFLS